MFELRGTLPAPTPETMEFWSGTRQHKLLLQRCDACSKTHFPPRPFCPICGCRNVSVFAASGRAKLYSYTIDYINPGAPFAVACVELEEGVRMMTNLVDVEQTPEALQLDMPLEVTFQRVSENITLPLFRPAAATVKETYK